jgi:hypothetical protein
MIKKKLTISQSVFLGLLLASGLFLLLNHQKASAYTIENYQENVEDRFVISPVNLELNLSPGETTTQTMMIVNRLGRTADFKIEKEDFEGSQDPEKSTVFLGDDSSGVTSAKDWIKPEVTDINLNHGDRLSLPIEITVPQDASAGSHYAAVFASVNSEDQNGGKDKIQLVSRAGLLVLINVPGENKEAGQVTEFKSDKKFYKNGPVDFSTVFQNDGNVYERVRAEISIKNILGAEVGHVTVPEWVVLSNSSRRQTAEWGKTWLFGRYDAHITMFYGFGGNLKLERDVVFYAFPWHVALILILIFIVIYYLFRYLASKFEIKRKSDGDNDIIVDGEDLKNKGPEAKK